MQYGFRRSSLELRGPRNGLGTAPRSSPGADNAPEALSQSCLNKQLTKLGSCLNKQRRDSW
eukprot:15422942-Alexandrium_andersonii.AAC.1